jgi:hypothetical protein
MTQLLIAGLIGALIGAAILGMGLLVFRWLNQFTHRIEAIEEYNRKLREELNAIQVIKERSRQTGPTLAGIENIQSALIRIKYDRQYEDELLDASMRTLSQIRKGPYAYNPDTPCVQRKDS